MLKHYHTDSRLLYLLRRPNYIEFDPFEFRSSPVLHKILSTDYYLISIVYMKQDLWQTGCNLPFHLYCNNTVSNVDPGDDT